MATYYVRTDGNDANDGLTNSSGGAFLTWGQAASVATVANDIVYVQAGTYTTTSTADNVPGGFVRNINSVHLYWEGFENTPGDLCPTNNWPKLVAHAAAAQGSMIYSDPTGNGPHFYRCLHLDGGGFSHDGFGTIGVSDMFTCRTDLCRVENCTNGFKTVTSFRCIANDCTDGFSGSGDLDYCIAYSCSQRGIDSAASAHITNCISYGNTEQGVKGQYLSVSNCIAYNNTLAGFYGNSTSMFMNCVSVNNLWGFDYLTGDRNWAINCATFGNSSGAFRSPFGQQIGSIVLGADPFVNAASQDFTTNDVANGGELIKQASITFAGQVDFSDLGPYQSEPAASGSTIIKHPPFMILK